MNATAITNMSAAERIAEIGTIFASAIQRLLAHGIQHNSTTKIAADPLALTGNVEPPCVGPVEDPA